MAPPEQLKAHSRSHVSLNSRSICPHSPKPSHSPPPPSPVNTHPVNVLNSECEVVSLPRCLDVSIHERVGCVGQCKARGVWMGGNAW